MTDSTGNKNIFSPRKNLVIKELPEDFVLFQRELSQIYNLDLALAAHRGRDFEEAMANICTALGIVVDGYYDVAPMCKMLVEAMQARQKGHGSAKLDKMLEPIVRKLHS